MRIKWKGTIVEVELRYGVKHQFSAEGVPDEVVSLSSTRFRNFERKADLEKAIRDAVLAYHEKMKQSKKVIVFTVSMSHPFKDDRFDFIPDGIRSSGTSDGTGVAIRWETFLLITADKMMLYEIDKNGEPKAWGREYRSDGDERLIDWTPGRERFFESLDGSMIELMKRIVQFFDRPEADLLQTIDTSKLLLTDGDAAKKKGDR